MTPKSIPRLLVEARDPLYRELPELIRAALATAGTVDDAARALGVRMNTLRLWMAELGIDKDPTASPCRYLTPITDGMCWIGIRYGSHRDEDGRLPCYGGECGYPCAAFEEGAFLCSRTSEGTPEHLTEVA